MSDATEFEDEFLPLHSMLEVSLVEENRLIDTFEDAVTSQSENPATVGKGDTSLESSTVNVSVPIASVEEEELQFYNNLFADVSLVKYLRIHCTICDVHIGCAPQSSALLFHHRILRVIVCQSCYTFYGSGEFPEEDGSDIYCRWCGQGGQLLLCSNCTNAFCKKCIKRNYTKKIMQEIDTCPDWLCLLCNYRSLWEHRALCRAANSYIKMESEKWNCGERGTREVYGPEKPVPGFDASFCCKLPVDSWAKKIRPFKSGMPNENILYSILQTAAALKNVNGDAELLKFLNNLKLKESFKNNSDNNIGVNQNSAPTNTVPPSTQVDPVMGINGHYIAIPLNSVGNKTPSWHTPQTPLSNLQNTVHTIQKTNYPLNLGSEFQNMNTFNLHYKEANEAKASDSNKCVQSPSLRIIDASRMAEKRSDSLVTDRNKHANNNMVIDISKPTLSNTNIANVPSRVNCDENVVPVPVININNRPVNITPKPIYSNSQNNTMKTQPNSFPSGNRYQKTDIPQTNNRFLSRNKYLNSSFSQMKQFTTFNKYLNIPQSKVFRVYKGVVTLPKQIVQFNPVTNQNRNNSPPLIQIDDNYIETIDIDKHYSDDEDNDIIVTDPLNLTEDNQTNPNLSIDHNNTEECITSRTKTGTATQIDATSDIKVKFAWLESSFQNADTVSKIMASRILEMKKSYEALINTDDVKGLKILTKKVHRLLIKATESILKLDLEVIERNKKWADDKSIDTVIGKHQGTNNKLCEKNSNTDLKTGQCANNTNVDSIDSATTNKPHTAISLDMDISYESDQENSIINSGGNLICSTPTTLAPDDWGSLSGDEDHLSEVLNLRERCIQGGAEKMVSEKEDVNLNKSSSKISEKDKKSQILRKLKQIAEDDKNIFHKSTSDGVDVVKYSGKAKYVDASVQTDTEDDKNRFHKSTSDGVDIKKYSGKAKQHVDASVQTDIEDDKNRFKKSTSDGVDIEKYSSKVKHVDAFIQRNLGNSSSVTSRNWATSYDKFLKDNHGTVKHESNYSACKVREIVLNSEALSTSNISHEQLQISQNESCPKSLKLHIKKNGKPNVDCKIKFQISKERHTAKPSRKNTDDLQLRPRVKANSTVSVQMQSSLKRRRITRYSKERNVYNSGCNGNENISYKNLLLNPLYAKPCYVKLVKYDGCNIKVEH